MPTPRSYYKSRRQTSTWQRTTQCQRRTTTSCKPTTYTKSSAAFRNVRGEYEWRMQSYRTVYTQFTGAGQKTPFSPTNANRWLRYINQGYRVYNWTNREFCRFFGAQWQTGSPTACFRYMRQRFGSTVKAVARGKGNCWLVATSQHVNGQPFRNYRWR